MSLRLRLILLALAVLLPGLVAALWVIDRAYESERVSLQRGLRETTRALSMVIDRELGKRETVARMLADSPYLDNAPDLSEGDLRNFYEQSRRATEGMGGWIVLSTPQGQVLNTLRPFGEALPKRPDGTAARFPFVTVPQLSGLARGAVSNELAAAMQVPVTRKGATPMNVGLTMRATEFQRLVDSQRMPPDWIIAIVDSAGTIVARKPDAARWVGQPATSESRARIAAGTEGFFDATSLEGTANVAFFSKSESYGWGFVIAVPKNVFGDSLGRSVSEVAIGAVALLVVALIGSAWVARGVEKPVHALQSAARTLERGEVVEAQSTGAVECDEVSATLAQASRQIARSRVELEERVSAAVRQTKDALEQLAQSQRLEALGQLTGGVAHDFNNLLAVIGNNTFVLQRATTGKDGSTATALGAISRAVQVGSRLTGHLLRFARRSEVKPEVIDLARHLPSLTEILKAALGSAVSVAMRVESTTRSIECDTGELELALINLAVNSRDAMPAGGEFIIVARNATPAEATGLAERDYVVIAVSDNGLGIVPEAIDRVFEPFFTTKGLGKGTGLGLSQVYGFSTQAGGTARLLATSAAGTTVLMLLPATTKVSEASTPVTDTAPAPEHRELLLVEDNDELGQATETLLTLFGYRVTRASSAEEAIELLDAGDAQFDVVLSDVVMPGGMNGVSFAQYLRKDLPDMPIILITGYASHLRDKRGFEILQKPCAPDVLLAALRRATGQAVAA
ncbi:MAG: response regulator [Caldimonas sp.]